MDAAAFFSNAGAAVDGAAASSSSSSSWATAPTLSSSTPSSAQHLHRLSYLAGANARKRSCETCRIRKVKCDAVRPACGYCLRKGILPCVFIPPKDRGPLRYVSSAEASAAAATSDTKSSTVLQSILADPSMLQHSLIPSISTTASANSELPQRQQQQHQQLPRFGPPTLLRDATVAPRSPKQGNPNRRPGAPESEERILIEAFFRSGFFGVMFVHRTTLLRNSAAVSPLVRMAVCSAAAFVPRCVILSETDGRWYHRRAQELLNESLDTPTVDTLQALLLIAAVESCSRIRHESWELCGLGASLAVCLELYTDPDDLPGGSEMSWVEKETRRRCWWFCLLMEQVSSSFNFDRPLIPGNGAAVKPMCPDELWLSPKDPVALQQAYAKATLEPGKNIVTHMAALSDLLSAVLTHTLSNAAFSTTADATAVEEKRARLESSLLQFWHGLPYEYKVILCNDWLFEKMIDDVYTWSNLISIHFAFHGAAALLMRRGSLTHIHNVATALESLERRANTDGSALPSALQEDSTDAEAAAAFAKALTAATQAAGLAAALLASNALMHHIPHPTIFYIFHSGLVLAAAESLPTPFFDRIPAPERNTTNFENCVGSASDSPAPAATAAATAADACSALLRALADLYPFAAALAELLARFRRSDWVFVDTVAADPMRLFFVDANMRSLPGLLVSAPWVQERMSLGVHLREFAGAMRRARDISGRIGRWIGPQAG